MIRTAALSVCVALTLVSTGLANNKEEDRLENAGICTRGGARHSRQHSERPARQG